MVSILSVSSYPQNVRSISFKAKEQQAYNNTQTQANYQNPAPKKKKIFTAQAVITALGLTTSVIMATFFGRLMIQEIRMRKLAEKALKDAVKDFNAPKAKSIVDVIDSCADPALRRAAMNEYNKGSMMSSKRLNDILSLANLDNAKPQEIDLNKAIDLIEKKIVGMDEVKEEILDFLVEQNYNIRNEIAPKKPLVLCLDGPAGTGKTTVSEVLAEAMQMHYKKISLNGASGKSSIRGYEAVYTGASSGGIAQGQLEGKTKRVLYCLDEVDKTASSDYNGRVEDTLLPLFDDQVLFTDDNLDVPIDVKNSVFILTTNNFEKLSDPLKNRVRKIGIKPYGTDVKSKIAQFKMNNALKESKLDSSKVQIAGDDVFRAIAETTKDQGGRETTQQVQSLIKKIITIIELGENKGEPIILTPEFVKKELGPVTEKESLVSRVKRAKIQQKTQD